MTTRACMCLWPSMCNGTGVLHCDGCGGDLCVCRCGGESTCMGCDHCEPAPPSDSYPELSDEDLE